MAMGHREFVKKNPVATKRALRALLKATDLCAREPEQVARLITDKGYVKHLDYALQAMMRFPTIGGGPMTPRTRCASTRSAFTRSE